MTPTKVVERPGMASNVYENLLSFALDVDFLTYEDSVINTRYVDERYNYQLFRVERNKLKLPGTPDIDVEGYDAVVVSDYGTGFVTYEMIEQIQRDFDGPVFIDSKKTDLNRFKDCYIKINQEEYEARTSDGNHMIVSMGGKGAMYNNITYPVPTVEVADVCGAGDTFLSALVAGFIKYNNMSQAIAFANHAGALAVQHIGCYTLTANEITDIEEKFDEVYC